MAYQRGGCACDCSPLDAAAGLVARRGVLVEGQHMPQNGALGEVRARRQSGQVSEELRGRRYNLYQTIRVMACMLLATDSKRQLKG